MSLGIPLALAKILEPEAIMRLHRVIVVSDIRLFREGLTHVLRRDGRLDVVGAVARDEQVIDSVRTLQPEAVLYDMGSPQALRTVRAVSVDSPSTKIIALGVSEEPNDILKCAAEGIAGYVCREGSLNNLVDAVDAAMRQEFACTPKIAAALLRQVAIMNSEQAGSELSARLTSREMEIVRLIDAGLSNKEIANKLRIQVSTVKNHVHNTLEKLGVHRRSAAVAKLQQIGLLQQSRVLRTP